LKTSSHLRWEEEIVFCTAEDRTGQDVCDDLGEKDQQELHIVFWMFFVMCYRPLQRLADDSLNQLTRPVSFQMRSPKRRRVLSKEQKEVNKLVC